MSRVAVIHWNPAGAAGLVHVLRSAGHLVEELSPQGTPGLRGVRDNPPDAFVIDLDRRPSDGRETGTSLRRYKATQHVPLVFVGGAPEKVDRVRGLLPDAGFTELDSLAGAVDHALRNPPAEPVVPGTMDAYSGAPLTQKLGIKPDSRVALLGAPQAFERRLGEATITRDGRKPADVALLFVRKLAELETRFPTTERVVDDGGSLWLVWPKKASGVATDLSQTTVQRYGLDRGWVDFKVAAIDGTWSGLRFARRRR